MVDLKVKNVCFDFSNVACSHIEVNFKVIEYTLSMEVHLESIVHLKCIFFAKIVKGPSINYVGSNLVIFSHLLPPCTLLNNSMMS